MRPGEFRKTRVLRAVVRKGQDRSSSLFPVLAAKDPTSGAGESRSDPQPTKGIRTLSQNGN